LAIKRAVVPKKKHILPAELGEEFAAIIMPDISYYWIAALANLPVSVFPLSHSARTLVRTADISMIKKSDLKKIIYSSCGGYGRILLDQANHLIYIKIKG
jgi:hypothetical protein